MPLRNPACQIKSFKLNLQGYVYDTMRLPHYDLKLSGEVISEESKNSISNHDSSMTSSNKSSLTKRTFSSNNALTIFKPSDLHTYSMPVIDETQE